MVDEKMLVSALKNGDLLVRVDAGRHEELLRRPGATQAKMGPGRDMGPGWIEVEGEAISGDRALSSWFGIAMEHNRAVTGGRPDPPTARHRSEAEELAEIVGRLRAAGCVFAEEEAEILAESAGGNAAVLDRLVTAREEGAPLEPLVGWVEFAGQRLAVGSGVFVPRQRTLQLLERSLHELRRVLGERTPVFVEAFAGVAPLAAAVGSALPEARVLACERDPAALSYAVENLGPRGTAHLSDVLSGLPEDRGAVDVIAAVPPYVPAGEIRLLPREAREHEPRSALDGGSDGLDRVRALIDDSLEWIAPQGVLLIELSEAQLERAERHARANGWRPETAGEPGDPLTGVLSLRAPGRPVEVH